MVRVGIIWQNSFSVLHTCICILGCNPNVLVMVARAFNVWASLYWRIDSWFQNTTWVTPLKGTGDNYSSEKGEEESFVCVPWQTKAFRRTFLWWALASSDAAGCPDGAPDATQDRVHPPTEIQTIPRTKVTPIRCKRLRSQEARLPYPGRPWTQDSEHSWVCSGKAGGMCLDSGHRLSGLTRGIYAGATGVLVMTHSTPASPRKTKAVWLPTVILANEFKWVLGGLQENLHCY